jgi:tetrapyrrole methylase family protein/MazG family protein
MNTLTIIGLGPGSPDDLTRAAERGLREATRIFVGAPDHPVLAWLRATGATFTATSVDSSASANDSEHDNLATQFVAAAADSAGVAYATAGNPLTDDPLVPAIVQRAKDSELSVAIIPGLGLAEAALRALSVDVGTPGARRVHPNEFVPKDSSNPFRGVYRHVEPTMPLLVGPILEPAAMSRASAALRHLYPLEHRVSIVCFVSSGDRPSVTEGTIDDLARGDPRGGCCFIYAEPLPRLSDLPAFDTLRYIVARLRAPDGCPWDREQTYQSMKKHLIEETYEAVAALDGGDLAKLAEELGDVLLQVVMYAQFGREASDFTLEDVLRAINAKLIRRHPHVFGDVAIQDSAEVLRNWERIKQSERTTGVSSFGGIPDAAPALMRAEALLGRAERYGIPAVEVATRAGGESPSDAPADRLTGLGWALLRLVGEARRDHLDPEEALRLVTNHLRDAFDAVLAEQHRLGPELATLSLDERQHLIDRALSAPGQVEREDVAHP